MTTAHHISGSDNQKEKKCPVCNTRFLCLHNRECWCMDYSLTAEALAFLQQRYNDCLCPACLLQYGILNNDANEVHTHN